MVAVGKASGFLVIACCGHTNLSTAKLCSERKRDFGRRVSPAKSFDEIEVFRTSVDQGSLRM